MKDFTKPTQEYYDYLAHVPKNDDMFHEPGDNKHDKHKQQKQAPVNTKPTLFNLLHYALLALLFVLCFLSTAPIQLVIFIGILLATLAKIYDKIRVKSPMRAFFAPFAGTINFIILIPVLCIFNYLPSLFFAPVVNEIQASIVHSASFETLRPFFYNKISPANAQLAFILEEDRRNEYFTIEY